jgi:hypothetical protein
VLHGLHVVSIRAEQCLVQKIGVVRYRLREEMELKIKSSKLASFDIIFQVFHMATSLKVPLR